MLRAIRLRWVILTTRRSRSPFKQYQLGALYARGLPPAPKNIQQALVWYREAATSGYRDAQYALGALYLDEQFGDINPREGLRWLALAAQQDHRQAIQQLADIYRTGRHGVAQDVERARFWQAKLDKEIFA